MNSDKSVTVTFDRLFSVKTTLIPSDGGNVTLAPSSASGFYRDGSTVGITATANQGWAFRDGRFTGQQCPGPTGILLGTSLTKDVTINGADINCMANFVKLYSLTVNKNPAAGGNVSASPEATGGGYRVGTTVTLTASPLTGYLFKNWSGCDTTSGMTCTVTMNSAKSVTANFSQTYLLTLTSIPLAPLVGGSVTASPSPNASGGRYVYGTKVTVTATPAPNYAIGSWTGCSPTPANASSCAVTMDADKSVSVTFVRTYSLTATRTPTNGGSISISPPPNAPLNKYKAGTAVTVTAAPAPNYAIGSWKGCVPTTAVATACVVSMDADKSVSVTFVQTFTLTATITPINGGSISLSPPPNAPQNKYKAGTVVTVTATPKSGWGFKSAFGSWSGCDSNVSKQDSSQYCTVTMNSNKSVIVTLVRVYALTIIKSPEDGGTVSASPEATGGGYPYGTTVTLTASPLTGYLFKDWIGCESTNESKKTCTVTMKSDKSVTANFSQLYRLTLTSIPLAPLVGGSVTASPSPNASGGRYVKGTKVTVTASPADNYAIDSWTGCDAPPSAGASTCTVTMDGDKSVSVTFVRTFTLTVTQPAVGGSISVSPSPNAPFNKYKAGTEITITAAPSPPTQTAFYSFDSWTGDCPKNTTPVCTVTIDKDMTVSATFIIAGTSVNPTLCCPFDLRSEKIENVGCGSGSQFSTRFIDWNSNRSAIGEFFPAVTNFSAWCMDDQTENRSWRWARQIPDQPSQCACVSCGFATATKTGSSVSFTGCNVKCVLPEEDEIEWMKVLKNNSGQVSELTTTELKNFKAGTESFSVACVPVEIATECKLKK